MNARSSALGRIAAWLPAVLWASLIFYASSRSTVPAPFGISMLVTSVVGHLTGYAVLALLFRYALARSSVSRRRASAVAVVLAMLYGLSDEWHQSFVPGRDASLFDLAVDLTGAAIGVALFNTIEDRRSRQASEHTVIDGQ